MPKKPGEKNTPTDEASESAQVAFPGYLVAKANFQLPAPLKPASRLELFAESIERLLAATRQVLENGLSSGGAAASVPLSEAQKAALQTQIEGLESLQQEILSAPQAIEPRLSHLSSEKTTLTFSEYQNLQIDVWLGLGCVETALKPAESQRLRPKA